MAEEESLPPLTSKMRLDELAKAAAFGPTLVVGSDEILCMVHELEQRRRSARLDSRRAQQIKRLRWVAENLVMKVERMERGDSDAETAPDASLGPRSLTPVLDVAEREALQFAADCVHSQWRRAQDEADAGCEPTPEWKDRAIAVIGKLIGKGHVDG